MDQYRYSICIDSTLGQGIPEHIGETVTAVSPHYVPHRRDIHITIVSIFYTPCLDSILGWKEEGKSKARSGRWG